MPHKSRKFDSTLLGIGGFHKYGPTGKRNLEGGCSRFYDCHDDRKYSSFRLQSRARIIS